MTNKEAKEFLCCEFVDLITLALEYVNLTRKHKAVLEARCRDGLTIEEAADELQMSETTIKKLEREALERCAKVWDNSKWINSIIKKA